jgi:streptogrisin C
MHAARIRALAAAGIAAVGFGTIASSAVAADDGKNPIETAIDAYRSAYPGLSAAQARAAATGSDARRAVYDAAAADAQTFGGAWFDPQTGLVNLAGTTAAANEAALALGRRYGVAVKAHRVARSAAQLERQADRLRAGEGPIGQAAAGQVGIDVQSNQVVAAVPKGRKAGLPAQDGVRIIDDPGHKVDPDYGCTSRSACDWTIRAGAIMWRSNTSTPWCSVGFTARNSSNTRYVYTAGHCSTGNGIGWGTGSTSIGPMISSRDSGNIDAAIIQVTNSWFTGDSGGEIYFADGGARTAPVKGVAPTVSYMVPGETVCLSANFTSPSASNPCGVLGSNSDAGVRGMARVDGVDACGGDSGGGWYWLSGSGNRYAYGIHSRSDSGCHGDAGGNRSWYSAIATVKSGFQPSLNVEIRP